MKELDLGCGDGTTAIPEAERGAGVLGVDIAGYLVEAGNKRAAAARLTKCTFQEDHACNIKHLPDKSFDWVVSIFGAMFAPKPSDVAKEIVRATKPGGKIVVGNWIPDDPTLVAQILRISSAYTPPPPEGFISPMTWGVEGNVVERFGQAGISKEQITCEKDTFTFEAACSPAEYLSLSEKFYGPNMNAFKAAVKDGKSADLQQELTELFNRQNQAASPDSTLISVTYIRVTMYC